MRKAFECVLCEGIYADAPVSECDCASKANVFSEGVILGADEWESLRKDAERYRWFRDCGNDWHKVVVIDSHGRIICEEVDAAIDAAISSPENP